MKYCNNCKTHKSTEDFSKSSKKKDGLQATCKQCRAEYNASRYQEKKVQIEENKKEYKKTIRKNVFEYKSTHPCITCGESDPVVLEFDHVDTKDKLATISNMAANGWGWSTILLEIEKCVVLCANCHRRRTAKQFDWHNF